MTQVEYERLIDAIEKVRVKYTRSKRAARKFLRSAGIVLEEDNQKRIKTVNRKKENQ